MKHFSCLLLVLSLGATACAEAAPELVARKDFCDGWAKAACTTEVVSACQAASSTACQDSQMTSCLGRVPENFSDLAITVAEADACNAAVHQAYLDADLTAEELDVVLRLGAPCDAVRVSESGGDECASDNDCDQGTGLRCIFKAEATGHCEVPEIVKAGFRCKERQQQCEDGFYCDGANCITTLDEGTDCVNDSQCGSDSYCDTTCKSRKEIGDDCGRDAECSSALCYGAGGADLLCTDRIRLSRAEPMCSDLR